MWLSRHAGTGLTAPKGSPSLSRRLPCKSQLPEYAICRFLLVLKIRATFRNLRDLHFPYPGMLRTIFPELLTTAQVAFDYSSTAFYFQQGPRGTTRVYWSCPSVTAPLPRPNVPSYHRRSTIRSFNWPAKFRVANRSTRGPSATKASHTYRMSRSTRNYARRNYTFSKLSVEF